MIGSDGRSPQTLIGRQGQYQPIPLDWSRDGANVLCWLRQKNDTADLALVSTAGGPPHVLSTFRTDEITNDIEELSVASLSPDSRFVVLTLKTASEPVRHDIVILTTDASTPETLVRDVNDEASPVWTSDGRQLVFARASAKSPATDRDAWVLPILDGVAQAEPIIAASNIGASNRMAVTDDGRLYIAVTLRSTEIFTRSIDLSGDTAPGNATRIVKAQLGEHVAPSWSPDGRSLAYFTTRQRSSAGSTPLRTLTILDVQSGRIHSVPPLGFQGGVTPQWFPDSRSVVVYGGSDFGRDLGYYRVDIATGETSPLVVFPRRFPLTNPGFSEVSADGRDFLYGDNERGVVARNLESGLERVVVARRADAALGRFGLSPDGQSIAFVTRSRDDGVEAVTTIEIQSIGEASHVLVRAVAPERLDFQAFTQDGLSVVFIRAGLQSGQHLWRVAASGGEPHDVHLTKANTPNAVSLSPDGRGIAYADPTYRQDLRVLPLNFGNPHPTRKR
jgi:Tol biopolymer transport system component